MRPFSCSMNYPVSAIYVCSQSVFMFTHPSILHHILVILVRRPYEVIVRNIGLSRKVLGGVSLELYYGLRFALRTRKMSAPWSQKALGSAPALAAAFWTFLRSALFVSSQKSDYLKPMFVCSCAHDRLLSSEHSPSFDDVRKDHGIQVSDMRGGVHIEDGRRNVIWLLRRRLGCIEPPGAIVD